jgi:hypothetical protein
MVGKKVNFIHLLALIEANSLLCRGLAQQLVVQSRKKLPINPMSINF